MVKNVLVISSTLRKNGNSEVLAKEFLRGVEDSGNNAVFISLQDKEIKFCKGCLACQKLGICVIKDDSNEIVEKMREADVIAFATPIYYYEMSGQLKTLLDRANALYASEYKFRDIYFLAAAADLDSHSADIAANGIKGWVACFSKAQFKGIILGNGVESVGDINNHPSLMQAYEAGKLV